MADIVDGLFLFWVLLCGGVITLGNTFEEQIKRFLFKQENQKAIKKNQNSSLDYSSPDYQRQQSSYESRYNSNHHYNEYSSNNNSSPKDYKTEQQQQDSYWNQQLYNRNSEAYTSNQSNGPLDEIYLSSSKAGQFRHPLEGSIQQTSIDGLLGGSHEKHFKQQQGSSDNQQHLGSIPTASGFNSECVDWLNSILYLFYSQPEKYAPLIAESICRSLNEKLSGLVSATSPGGQTELMLEFMSIDRQLSTRPEITNIRTENESEKSVSATCKIYNRSLVFELATRRLGLSSSGAADNDGDDVALYELSLEQLEGKLKSVAVLNDKLIVVQFMDKPSTKVLLRRIHKAVQPVSAPPISEDLLVSMILQALTQVVIDLYFGDDPDFPQLLRSSNSNSGYKQRLSQLKDSASEIKRHIKQDFFGTLAATTHNSSSSTNCEKERKLFIKILKAKNINYNQNVTCLLELDSPQQQALSSTKPASSNPFWDEHFLFNVNEKSGELLLELWDSLSQTQETLQSSTPTHQTKRRFFGGHQQSASPKKWSRDELTAGAKFLGQARVNVDDLRKNPVQKLSLTLESSASLSSTYGTNAPQQQVPYSLNELNNSVGGELQVELLFLEHSVGSTLQKSSSMGSLCCQQGDVVSVDRKITPTGYVITTTTITKPTTNTQKVPVHRPQQQQQQQQQQQRLSRYDQQLAARNQSPTSRTTSEHSELDGLSSHLSDLRSSNNDIRSQQQLDASSASAHDKTSTSATRSRSRSRSRSFLRAIKKRFSFSRTRSRSVGDSGNRMDDSRSALGHNLDAASMDSRSRASSVASGVEGRAKSVPASRDPNEVPTIVINKGRLSDTASVFTFTHPKSQLVIECAEPRMGPDGSAQKKNPHYKYYAISEKASNKWKKRGTKLHLFNEHQFIASHLAGSSTCHLCGKVFSRRPGKQGYKCRNCHLLSHKQCHVKVDHNCPYATADGLKLEFIDQDPPAALIDSATSSSQQPRTTTRPMTAKSISMDIDDR